MPGLNSKVVNTKIKMNKLAVGQVSNWYCFTLLIIDSPVLHTHAGLPLMWEYPT